MFLEILQNSQENTCAWVSFLIKLHTSAWHRYFPVNFLKFLQNTSGRLLLLLAWLTNLIQKRKNHVIVKSRQIIITFIQKWSSSTGKDQYTYCFFMMHLLICNLSSVEKGDHMISITGSSPKLLLSTMKIIQTSSTNVWSKAATRSVL